MWKQTFEYIVLSGYHLALAFSKDALLTKEKHIMNTSVCGYDRGRNLS